MASKIEQRLAAKTQRLARQPEQDAPAGDPPAQATNGGEGPVAPQQPSSTPAAPRTPRTPVTMPGQLGAFRQEAQKWADQIAERDAEIERLKNSTDRIQKIRLALVDDSPYQPRLEYDPEEIDALAKTMAASKQADPIKVRKVGDRYEIISGHRRKRAGLSLGWTEIDAIVENRTDEQAELEAMLLVVANVQLSDYEFGKMYRRALDKGFCKTQREAAAMFGVTPAAVTGRLDMLSLPSRIIEILEAKPSLFSYSTSNVIKGLVQEHPRSIEIIVQGVRRLVEEGATQGSLKGWVLQAIAQQGRRSSPRAAPRIVTKDGRQFFSTKSSGNAVTVNIKTRDLDGEQFEKDLHDWLTAYANGKREP
jgi:ParB/RepB/Spo0J family partition protein